ncbi:MAG: 50S ribosome-binding GTPase [Thermoplasmata archaeon]|nr:50S ribosome-binding GTPase [Thermoplasmata archaeon]
MLRIPTVLTADELIERAFKKASKVNVIGKSKRDMIKQKNLAKVNSVADTISSTLEKYVSAFPTLEKLPAFYREIIDLLIGLDELKKSLGASDWCAKQVRSVARINRAKIKRSRNVKEMDESREAMYGRSASLVKQISKELIFLNKARNQIKNMPTISPEMRTIVIAGAPNVGKSLLVAAISSAKPKVAIYPFTTKEISVGVLTVKRTRYQVIDTPGLLDRPFEDRNEIELQAIIALRHLADLVVFLLDPTGTCGYPLDYQLSLLDGIRVLYPDARIVVVENKSDLHRGEEGNLKISALTKEGIGELTQVIEKELSMKTQS